MAKIFAIMDWYKSNMAENAVEMAWDQQQAAYIKGEAAMMVQGLWALPNAKDHPELKSGFIPFPWSNKASENRFFADVDSTFAVSAQSSPEKQAAALKFINWLNSPEAEDLDDRYTAHLNLQGRRRQVDGGPLP